MSTRLVSIARTIYRITPFPSVRKFYYDTFCKVVSGKKLTCDLDGVNYELDLGQVIDNAAYLGEFETEVVAAITKCCRPGWTVLDIGANVGIHSMRLAQAVGKTGMVYAFEPTDFAFSKLMRNVSLNPSLNVMPFQLALSNENRPMQQVDFRSNWRTDRKVVDAVSVVDVERLDEWADRTGANHIDLIKIDVDGNEYPIFDGARKLFKDNMPVIFMEVGAWHFGDIETNPLVVLRELGYRFFEMETSAEYPSMDAISALLPHHDPNMTFSINLIAAPESPDNWRGGL